MTETTHDDPIPLDLSPEEAWVIHAAVLAALERTAEANESAQCETAVLETVEGDQLFTRDELRSMQRALEAYLDGAPEQDRDIGRSVLDTLDTTLA